MVCFNNLNLIFHISQALESYKRAYELDQTNDLVLKICGLMLELPIEPGRAKYWVEVRVRSIPDILLNVGIIINVVSRWRRRRCLTTTLSTSCESPC